MARQPKIGLEYFPLDCDIDQDDKMALIEAQHGLIGFGVTIKLLMKIYDQGYFYQWTEKEQLLFSKRVNVDINEVNAIINNLIKWKFFNKELFEKENILTSKGIQRRYLDATTRRQKVKILKNYLLLDVETMKSYNNLIIVDINTCLEVDNVDINAYSAEVNTDISTQSKVKKSKEYNMPVSDESGDCDNSQQAVECAKTATEKISALTVGKLAKEYSPDFERFWSTYSPERRVEKKAAFKCWNARIKSGVLPDDLIKAAANYALQVADTEKRFIKQPKTFLGSNEPYKDYLPCNAQESQKYDCEILGVKIPYDSNRQVWLYKGIGYKYKTDLEQLIREEGDLSD